MTLSGVPFNCTATALSAMSSWPVTFAAGAFAFSHCLKSFLSADSWARYDFTVLLEKSIFFPAGGLVLTYVESGSPLSWTIALPVSTVAAGVPPSETVREPATAAPATSAETSAAAARRPLSLRTDFPPLSFPLAGARRRLDPTRAPGRRGDAAWYHRIAEAISREFAALMPPKRARRRSEEHTSELQSHSDLVCRLLLEKKKKI